jgi:hypothetical protein
MFFFSPLSLSIVRLFSFSKTKQKKTHEDLYVFSFSSFLCRFIFSFRLFKKKKKRIFKKYICVLFDVWLFLLLFKSV